MVVRFIVPGEPTGKGRPKFSTQGGFARAITPLKTVSYETFVKFEYDRQSNFHFGSSPIAMKITAFYSIPKSVTKKSHGLMLDGTIKPTKKPDLDNVIKIIADSLNGIAYKDDSQIASVVSTKQYADIPRVEVEIWAI